MAILFATYSFGQAKEMSVRFSVLDEKNEPFRDLKAEDVSFAVNKRNLQPISISASKDVSLETLILIDASVSQEKVLPAEIKIAEYFIDNVLRRERDSVGIAKFTNSLDVLYRPATNFIEARTKLETIKFEPPPGYLGGGIMSGPLPANKSIAGSTSLFDAVLKGSEILVAGKDAGTRRVVLLISDGVNTSGNARFDAVINELIKSGVAVYAVGVGDSYFSGVDAGALKKLTASSGGLAIVPYSDFSNTFVLMAKLKNALFGGYQLTFSTPSADPDRLAETSIQIINPELKKRKLQVFQPKGIFMPI